MTVLGLLAQVATVTPRGDSTEDEYGDVTTVDGTPVDYPCRLEQVTSVEDREGQNLVITEYALYLPPDAVIGARDKVTVDGVAFEVIRRPDVLRDRTTPHHIRADLRLIEGG